MTRFYGRVEEISAVTKSSGRVIIVAGNSGVGKSGLLNECTLQCAALAPPPVRVGFRAGALQVALLSSLGSVLSMSAANESAIESACRTLIDATRRLADARLRGIASASVAFLFGVIKDKLGNTAGGLIEGFVDQVSNSLDEQLANRVTAASDPDVIDSFLHLAKEVQMLLDTPLVLSLDGIERLGSNDLAALSDLVEGLPDLVQIYAAMTTEGPAIENLRILEAAGAQCIYLNGLPNDVVLRWIVSEGLDESSLERVLSVTDGYALFVDSAIAHLKSGLALEALPISESFIAQTRSAFSALTSSLNKACFLLSAFTDPPDVEDILKLLDVSMPEWLVVENTLTDLRLFATKVDGGSWFHELRRRVIWEKCLSENQKRYSAEHAFKFLLQKFEGGPVNLQHCADFVRVARVAVGMEQEHLKLVEALSLDIDELRLVASIIELSETSNDDAIEASALLEHARESLLATHAALPTLRSLENKGLVAVAENQYQAVVVPCWSSPAAYLALLGRVSTELNRDIVPNLASALFNGYLQYLLGPFYSAVGGIGRPSLVTQSEQVRSLQRDQDTDGIKYIGRVYPGLMVRAKIGGVDFYLSASFHQAAEVQRAAERLQNSDNLVFGQRFVVLNSWEYPGTLLPSRRFERPVNAALGRMNSFGWPRKVLPERGNMHLDESMTLRARTYQFLRDVSTPTEREVLSLAHPRGILFSGDDDSYMYAEVVGLDGAKRIESIKDPLGPFARMRIAEQAGLDVDQVVSRVKTQSGGLGSDPVLDVLHEAHEALHAYNRAQGIGWRKAVELDERQLASEILVSMNRSSADFESLIAAGLLPGTRLSAFRSLYLLIGISQESPYDSLDLNSFYLAVANKDALRNEVRVRVVRDPERGSSEEMFERYFGFDYSSISNCTVGGGRLSAGLGDLLGYEGEALRLQPGL